MNDLLKDPDFMHEPEMSSYEMHYTYEDYLKFTFEEMVEIISGKLVRMSPAPKRVHQKISGRIFSKVFLFLEKKGVRFIIHHLMGYCPLR
jgi:hypothetical protein